ncbi:MAG: 3-hydroxybutyrate oligomer hydrolase family protein [Acidimicrobiales bacterium]
MRGTRSRALLAGLLAATTLAADADRPNLRPPWIRGEILRTEYDGVTDDLLTAGVGRTGLASPVPPAFADPAAPTATELRRLAIYRNYRALVDMGPWAFGVLYGPNVTPDGEVTPGEGLIAGVEYLAYADRGGGREQVTVMVQIPASFDADHACIVTAPSSGSRTVYGAIATGEWGLKRGCAVAYTDKGTGVGAHDLEDDQVSLITGVRTDADTAGRDSNFTAPLSDRQREAFNAAYPDRFAWKHAHSERNPEADWDRDVLRSIEFAFHVLDLEYEAPITPANTIVIASSVSNGGASSLRAAEEDRRGLIDGIAVSEPNVNPEYEPGFAIVQGDGPPLIDHSRPLYDYTTIVNLFQGCANRAPEHATAPLNLTPPPLGDNRCTSLAEAGLVSGGTVSEQAEHAQELINAAGILPEQNVVQPSHWFLSVPPAISVTYANAYARASVLDGLCAYSFAGVDATGAVRELSAAEKAALFGEGGGIPPTAGVDLVNDLSVGGPRRDVLSTSPSTGRQDQNLDGARCLRSLWDGDFGGGADPELRRASRRLHYSIGAVLTGADLGGRPAVIVTGRADAIVAPNHASRPYYGRNQQVEGEASGLRYYEVLNAQHLDALNSLPGFDTRFVPLHVYLIRALDLVYDRLTTGTPLPPSQVVRAVPRAGGALTPFTPANLPPVTSAPPAGDVITFDGDLLVIPG